MRTLVLLLTLMATLPLTFVAPYAGVLVWCWLSFMNPQRITFGDALPVVYAAAVITAIGLVISREPKRLPNNLTPWLFVLLGIVMTANSFFALDPHNAWDEWNKNIKTLVMVITVLVVMTNRVRIHALIWVYVLSIGYLSLKGGLFTLLSGGQSHVLGVAGTATGDNNNLGLIMVMTLPLMYYLRLNSVNRFIRIGLPIMMGCTVVAVLGTYSRGAFLALSLVAGFFWWKAKQKATVGIIGALVLVPAVLFMPQQWVNRINTIDTYEADTSAMNRISQWHFAIRLATDRPLVGGGFDASESFYAVAKYYPDEQVLAYHSIWFQSLGDLGIPGIVLTIAIALVGWRNASVTRRAARSRPEFTWAGDLATMCQVSLAGYFLAGTFLSMAYYDGYYTLIAVLSLLREITSRPRSTLAARLERQGALAAPVPLDARTAAEAH
ncbi:MAG TPA: putative O-glycosylation ligase, exosortase A system-associated [Stellaceae bacterium]|nr:putative O-glycosylation ligase, exosortase A system-associated [Stellaceae bacterium]